MEAEKLNAFAVQVYLQSVYVWSAGVYLDEAVAAENTNRIFYHIQSMLTASANLSKLFWAQDDKGPQRAERQPLRDFYAINEQSPLFDRYLRNAFDHLDERLDQWWKASPNHNFVDRIIGNPSTSFLGLLDDKEFFRAYDHITCTAYFWNRGYSTKDLCAEAKRLTLIAQEAGL